jgi:uncharacterized UBP type Zn finger protein
MKILKIYYAVFLGGISSHIEAGYVCGKAVRLPGNNGKGAPQQSSSQGFGAPSNPILPQPKIASNLQLPSTASTVQAKTDKNSGTKMVRIPIKELLLPSGLYNFGDTCYANSAIQLLNAIEPFRKSIMNSQSKHSLVLGLQEMFNGINSSSWILNQESINKLKKLWEEKILPHVGIGNFSLTNTNNGFYFMLACFNTLDGKAEKQAVECFQYKDVTISQEKENSGVCRFIKAHEERNFCLDLLMQAQPEGKEIPEEFMKALLDFENKDVQRKILNGKEVDVIRYDRIEVPPAVLLMQVLRSFNKEDCRPMAIPLKFQLPMEIMQHPKPVEYKLIGGIIHQGPAFGKEHFIAHIATKDGFLEFNDDQVRQLGTSEGLNALKAGAYVVAYERQN